MPPISISLAIICWFYGAPLPVVLMSHVERLSTINWRTWDESTNSLQMGLAIGGIEGIGSLPGNEDRGIGRNMIGQHLALSHGRNRQGNSYPENPYGMERPSLIQSRRRRSTILQTLQWNEGRDTFRGPFLETSSCSLWLSG